MTVIGTMEHVNTEYVIVLVKKTKSNIIDQLKSVKGSQCIPLKL